MILPQSTGICVERLSKIFENKSESYKLFWFQAIVCKVLEGKTILTYEELIHEMIADAWYMVTEFRLNLGPSDTLEALVHHIFQISGLKTSEKKENILHYLEECEDKKAGKMMRTLINEVPYRLQSTLVSGISSSVWSGSKRELSKQLNQKERLLYYFSELSGMNTTISVQPEWCEYIIRNQDILKGWIRYHMIIYLQRRNPNVPGIADKIDAPQKRQLSEVIKYWKMILEVRPVNEIYYNKELTMQNISIDHFIPWSYVANDEFWNLHPTTKNINSSKGNHLPHWNKYFPVLCDMEYFSYQMMWERDAVHKAFDRCKKIHVNSNDVLMKLYRRGLSKTEFSENLETVLYPVYESAKNAGFQDWQI